MPAARAPERFRFTTETPAGKAELVYSIRDDGVMDLLHTFVPVGARGGTVASDLVRTAVDHAKKHGLRLVATCPYVQTWLTRHPEERKYFIPG
jgi:predicted GNAT family acetyltransferase